MGYLDPGLFGILSQIGVAILLVLVTAFALFSKSIKKFFAKIFKKNESGSEDKPKS
jgi:DNA-binding MltR family transcriptional regulator